MGFEFDPLPEGFGPRVEDLVNAALADGGTRVHSTAEVGRVRVVELDDRGRGRGRGRGKGNRRVRLEIIDA